jgi:alpha-tubulin suppressor-like RCC1 family protein
MRRIAALVIATVLTVAGLAVASPASAFNGGNGDGTQPIITTDNLTTCAIRETGMVYCFGNNGNGQLGRGSTSATQSVAPVAPDGSALSIAVSSGNSVVCAILLNHSVKCWGAGADGRLGNGTTPGSQSTPVQVTGLTRVTSISVGLNTVCATRQDGTVWCWGTPQFDDFTGLPTGIQDEPVKVAGVSNALSVSVGQFHACILRVDKRVVCWGKDSVGQLGDGIARGTGAGPTGLIVVPSITDAKSVVAGVDNTCAVRAAGTVYCWGDNTYGALGNRSIATTTLTPTAVYGISGATSLAMQGYGGCAIVAKALKCWGSDDLGRLGDEQFTTAFAPVRVTASQGNVTQVATSYWNSCEISNGGRIWCWGNGNYGQLGNGSTSSNYTGTGPGNAFGYAATPTKVTVVNSKPGTPTGSSTSAHKIKVSWAAPSTSGGMSAPKDYYIYYQLKGSSTWHRFVDSVSTSRSVYVSGLSSGKYYRFKVVPINWAGTGSTSSYSGYIKSR